MNEVVEKEVKIENMIYKIDGKEVMLDSDLAKLYHVETKRINEAVCRNKDKFPNRFSWILSDKQVEILWSQNATANISKMSRTNSRVFTEQGVYMLATVLRSKVATEVSIAIMDTFVKMRHYITLNNDILPNKVLLLEKKVDENTKKINELFDMFDSKEILNGCVYFENKLYDAYSALMNIFCKAKKEIIITDNYAGKELLDILRDINVNIIIISANISKMLKDKYEKQYKNVTFINDNSCHDRIIIIDREKLYICGTSLKDFGKKFSTLTMLNDKALVDIILDKISKIS